jgi:hypothetical protein
VVLWIALAIAFSPALLDMGRNLAADPYDLNTLVPALLLLGYVVAQRSQRAPGRQDGLAVLLAGLVLEILGIASMTWSLARLGVPVAIMGAARLTGFPSLRVAALALFVVPIPDFLILGASPDLEVALASSASYVASSFGAPLVVEALELRSAEQHLNLVAQDGGLVLLPLLMTIGWFHALRAGTSIPRALMGVAAWVLALLPIQVMALVIAGLLVAAGDPELARIWLRDGLWPLIAVVGLGVPLIRERHRLAAGDGEPLSPPQ